MAGALLAALRAKGVTAAELRGLCRRDARAGTQARACRRALRAVDIVGTGGDKSGSLNLSTGAALLAAACGLPVVKHGNRAVSSRAGSADVLEALGLAIALDEQRAGECFAATGFTFLFAPHYHPAMKSIAPVRAALGVRTVFNILGPLTQSGRTVVPGDRRLRPADRRTHGAGACGHGHRTRAGHPRRGGLGRADAGRSRSSCSTCARARCARERRDPADYGLWRRARRRIWPVAMPPTTRSVLQRTLSGAERGAPRDALLLGAALALEVTGVEAAPRLAVARAAQAIDSGRGRRAAWQSWFGFMRRQSA